MKRNWCHWNCRARKAYFVSIDVALISGVSVQGALLGWR